MKSQSITKTLRPCSDSIMTATMAEVGRVLDVVNNEEVGAGRAMLSAVVVHKGR